MNDPHGITAENLMRTLPVGIGWDETIQALGALAAETLSRRPEEIRRLLIYPNIDNLDEELLDILAYDFKVDWWDGDYSLEEKRRTLKDSWRVHRMLGTKAAVETAISAIYPKSAVKEWFEYGGRPYYFKLEINATGSNGDLDKQRRVLQRLNMIFGCLFQRLYQRCMSAVQSVRSQSLAFQKSRIPTIFGSPCILEVLPGCTRKRALRKRRINRILQVRSMWVAMPEFMRCIQYRRTRRRSASSGMEVFAPSL